MSCGVVRRCGSDPVLLWLWRKPVAAAPTGPLAWEPPYTAGAAQEMAKRQKKKKKEKKSFTSASPSIATHTMAKNLMHDRLQQVIYSWRTLITAMGGGVQKFAPTAWATLFLGLQRTKVTYVGSPPYKLSKIYAG